MKFIQRQAQALSVLDSPTFVALTVAGTGAGLTFSGRGALTAAADGVFMFRDSAGTSVGRVLFGGTSSSFPALKRNSAKLQAVLADDSGFATLDVNDVVANGAASTVTAGKISFGGTTQTTVGAAGGASALPATPTGYIIVNVAGTNRVVPFYAAS